MNAFNRKGITRERLSNCNGFLKQQDFAQVALEQPFLLHQQTRALGGGGPTGGPFALDYTQTPTMPSICGSGEGLL